MVDLEKPLTQSAFGSLVGISQQAVSDLMSRGVIKPGDAARDWLMGYCSNLREQAAGRMAVGELDLVSERARESKERADKLAMQNAVTRDELAPVHVIEQVLSRAGSRVAGILDAIPGALRRRLPLLTSEDVKLIEREIARARNIVAAVSLQDLEPDDGIAAAGERGSSASADVIEGTEEFEGD
jgi:terminase small subunit / prophage DNA-packing protein